MISISSLRRAMPGVLLFALLALASARTAQASASVTTLASSSISADTTGGTYTTLTGPVLTEGSHGDIGTGTIVLSAPTGFQFNTSATVTATVASAGGANGIVVTLSSGTATVPPAQ